MLDWLDYLRKGFARKLPQDRLTGQQDQAGLQANLKNIRPFLLRHWRKGVLGAGLILFVSLLSFLQPLINRFLVDQVILGKRLDLLLLAVLLLGGAKLFEMGANALEQYAFARFEQDILVDLQQTLLEHTLRLPKAFFDEKEVGTLMSRLVSDVQGLRWFFSSTMVYIASSILRFLGGAAFLFYLEWRLAIFSLIALPLLVISTRYFSRRMHILSHHGMEQNASVFQRIEETLASIPLIKASVSEKRASERIMAEVQSARQISMEQTVVGSLASLATNILPALARGVVLIASAYLVIRGEWTLGSLLAFQSYLGYVYGPALSLANANLQLQYALTALERVSAIFDILPEDKPGTGHKVEHLQGDVRFENVSFSYNGQEAVLEEISFHVHPGEHIAIVGPSGVGKTTLVSLLLQFYRPRHGEIYLDGQPAQQYDLGSLRERIGYVSQSTLLLEGTIRENLSYGNPGASQAQMDQAARIAGIQDFILGLPDRYETPIGERGANLSEGQRQRISIARALIKDPDILIMDEPTASVDVLAEHSILEALPQVMQHKTLIVVTHRPASMKKADRILLLNNGRLTASGTHEQLREQDAYYRSLFME